MKLALKFKDFPAPTAIFKDFQDLEFLFSNSRTFKVCVNPVFFSPKNQQKMAQLAPNSIFSTIFMGEWVNKMYVSVKNCITVQQ